MSGNLAYKRLDSGNLKKLEQVGEYRLIRPALNAFWRPSLPDGEWSCAHAELERDSRGNGHWSCRTPLPDEWHVEYAGFQLLVRPTAFGHLGFFAEQYRNWKFFEEWTRKRKNARALNLFAYSGIGSMAMAKGGAQVTHRDAARGMVEWAQANRRLNSAAVPDAIRWIVDDVMQFCRREARRGAKYNLIALDPPSFGRGSKGQVWKIEDDLLKLLEILRELRGDGEFLLSVSSHSPGFSAGVIGNMVESVFGKGRLAGGEMGVPETSGKTLPAGVCVNCFL